MNKIRVKLPFADFEIEQSEGGHPVTEAAAFLQRTIMENTDADSLHGLELGSGNGIISFMLALQRPQWKLTGVELQPELVELARSNNAGLGLNCSFKEGDLRNYQPELPYRAFELIYANPPWVKSGSGKVSPDAARAVSRQEISCTMRDVLACIEWCLSDQGAAWLIYPLQRQAELAREINITGLEVSRLIKSEDSPDYFIAKLKHKPLARQW